MSVWEAIMKLCALAGAVPEFRMDDDGTPTVYIADAEVVQDSGFETFTFERTDPDGTKRDHRVLTVGRDVWEMDEERHLESEVRLDRVDVVAYQPDTGKVLKGSYGTPGRKKSGTETVETITAHGITSQDKLNRLAESAYRSRVGREYSLSLMTEAPWTTGGELDGYDDLLGCASGATLELAFPGFEQRNMGGKTLHQDAELEIAARLGGPSLPWVEDAARAIASAMKRSRLGVLFQIKSLQHEFDDGGYNCTLEVHGFLEDQSYEASADLPRVLRDATAYSLNVTAEG